jgi:hypothetical protein
MLDLAGAEPADNLEYERLEELARNDFNVGG